MKKIISVFLAFILLFSATASLFSCELPPPQIPTADNPPEDGKESSIITPTHKEYPDRATIPFSEIVYSRPDVDKLTNDFKAATETISDAERTFDEKLAAIISLEGDYERLYTMLSYAKVMQSKDTSNEYWNDEYSYISEKLPAFSQVVEGLFVAAAKSLDAERFEDEYFGEGLIEKYSGGGSITDSLVTLNTKETELENEYSALSQKTVEITYSGETDSCESLIKKYEDSLGKDSPAFKKVETDISTLYEKARSDRQIDIYLELLKVRREIAAERGHQSYIPVAYEAMGHDYTEEKMLDFIDDIAKYILPVWATLEAYVFSTENFESDKPLDRTSLINGLYHVYEKMDERLFDAYSYMLQYGLFDISEANDTRFEGSFETYLDAYDAPYLFVTTGGKTSDFASLSHEFGHFFDGFVNYGNDTGIDLSEVSSTALEYLTFLNLDNLLGEDARGIHFSLVRDALSVFVFQSFYALFEHNVYALPKEEINEKKVTEAMYKAAERIGLNPSALVQSPDDGIYNALDYVLIPHVFLYPSYVESYISSTTVSLEIYFLEKANTGSGIDAYIKLINRDGTPLKFEDYIEDSGLKSPFDESVVKELAYKLYYDILGDYRYNENTGINSKKKFNFAA